MALSPSLFSSISILHEGERRKKASHSKLYYVNILLRSWLIHSKSLQLLTIAVSFIFHPSVQYAAVQFCQRFRTFT